MTLGNAATLRGIHDKVVSNGIENYYKKPALTGIHLTNRYHVTEQESVTVVVKMQ